ncbi:MAG: NAD(P)/FAD-dependent oxidoreductase [candidate division Zixibacteria bacterium]|nr:NAD(P)/FAD-dependent oxidoreductase [candidate division Zixibacteria bacterium]
MRSQYDAVVIGAGPAGSTAAYEIASAGFSVLLLEKHSRPGFPLSCAEAVSIGAVASLPEMREEWISTRIKRACLVGPNQCRITVNRKNAGYILDRPRFDFALAERARAAGADLVCNAIGRDLTRPDRLFASVDVLLESGETVPVEAKVFIAADGVESQIARTAGMTNLCNRDEVFAAAQYRVEEIDIESDVMTFYVGRKIAPGGYVWVFPKSDRSANIGIGITGKTLRGGDAVRMLNRFLRTWYPGGKIGSRSCGLVPTFQGTGTFRLHNILAVGDAARAIDSFSGAGIGHALSSGKHAGRAAAAYISGEITDIGELDSLYPGRYFDERLEELKLYARLRRAYLRFTDGDFNDIVYILRDYFDGRSADNIHVGTLIVHLIKTRPRLLKFIRYVL